MPGGKKLLARKGRKKLQQEGGCFFSSGGGEDALLRKRRKGEVPPISCGKENLPVLSCSEERERDWQGNPPAVRAVLTGEEKGKFSIFSGGGGKKIIHILVGRWLVAKRRKGKEKQTTVVVGKNSSSPLKGEDCMIFQTSQKRKAHSNRGAHPGQTPFAEGTVFGKEKEGKKGREKEKFYACRKQVGRSCYTGKRKTFQQRSKKKEERGNKKTRLIT